MVVPMFGFSLGMHGYSKKFCGGQPFTEKMPYFITPLSFGILDFVKDPSKILIFSLKVFWELPIR